VTPPATLPALLPACSYHTPVATSPGSCTGPAGPGKPLLLHRLQRTLIGNTTVKCKSVLARRTFCFNKKADLRRMQLWLYSVDAVYLDFSKAFDAVSHSILTGKLRKCGLDERSVRWIENWLNGRALRVVTSSAQSSWRQRWTWECWWTTS